jgi:hypothetical protein
MSTIRVVITGHNPESVGLLRRFISDLPGLKITGIYRDGVKGHLNSCQDSHNRGEVNLNESAHSETVQTESGRYITDEDVPGKGDVSGNTGVSGKGDVTGNTGVSGLEIPGPDYFSDNVQTNTSSRTLMVKTGNRTLFLDPGEIDWIEAAGNYLIIHVSGKSWLIRETMSGMEERLDPEIFTRIHRSAIVNKTRVREIRPLKKGSWLLVLNNGKKLTISRTYRRRFRELAGSRI